MGGTEQAQFLTAEADEQDIPLQFSNPCFFTQQADKLKKHSNA